MCIAINKATENTLLFGMHWLLRKVELTLKKKLSYVTGIVYHYVCILEKGQIEKTVSSVGT